MKRLAACLLLGWIMLLAGCSSTPEKAMISTRFQDIKPDETPPNYDIFGPGEVPSIYVAGYDAQTVTVEVFDISNGELIEKYTSYVPKGKDYYWICPELESGSYKAVASIGGVSQDMKLFNVRR